MKQHLTKTNKRKLVRKTKSSTKSTKGSGIKLSFKKTGKVNTKKMMKKGGRVVKVPQNATEYIRIAENITSLNLSNCPNLTKLVCNNNKITELDLSNCPNLTQLWCHQYHHFSLQQKVPK